MTNKRIERMETRVANITDQYHEQRVNVNRIMQTIDLTDKKAMWNLACEIHSLKILVEQVRIENIQLEKEKEILREGE